MESSKGPPLASIESPKVPSTWHPCQRLCQDPYLQIIVCGNTPLGGCSGQPPCPSNCLLDGHGPAFGRAAKPPSSPHTDSPLYIIVLVWYYVMPDGGTTASVARRAPILYGANGQYIIQYIIQYIDQINTRIDATGSFTDDHICTFSTRRSSREICLYMQTMHMSRDPPTDPSVHSYSNKVYETVSSMVSMETPPNDCI